MPVRLGNRTYRDGDESVSLFLGFTIVLQIRFISGYIFLCRSELCRDVLVVRYSQCERSRHRHPA